MEKVNEIIESDADENGCYRVPPFQTTFLTSGVCVYLISN